MNYSNKPLRLSRFLDQKVIIELKNRSTIKGVLYCDYDYTKFKLEPMYYLLLRDSARYWFPEGMVHSIRYA